MIRPSGTEPKLKLYTCARSTKNMAEAEALATALLNAMKGYVE